MSVRWDRTTNFEHWKRAAAGEFTREVKQFLRQVAGNILEAEAQTTGDRRDHYLRAVGMGGREHDAEFANAVGEFDQLGDLVYPDTSARSLVQHLEWRGVAGKDEAPDPLRKRADRVRKKRKPSPP